MHAVWNKSRRTQRQCMKTCRLHDKLRPTPQQSSLPPTWKHEQRHLLPSLLPTSFFVLMCCKSLSFFANITHHRLQRLLFAFAYASFFFGSNGGN
ncbi:hypothetical protein QVD17_01633 [Tagetes erecta]|uniref:Uncharacterized protein n=1 Tax=Tagetes erecta TaxID=13708 RepID=A0AAD8LAY3_TARER|nr:hypothetical protein QVD17_01633 [Tagetes erecta]